MSRAIGQDGYIFVKTLAGCDEAQMSWQTFDDSPAKRGELARVLHGPLRTRAKELARLNHAGGGVFATINRTDLRGRRESNITGLRALFVDADGVELPSTWPLEPSIIVQSGRGQHAYWLVHPDEPLELFSGAQKRLAAALGTDPSVHDLPRVMRLPGTYHMKGDPFAVRLVHAEPENIYTIPKIIAAVAAPRIA